MRHYFIDRPRDENEFFSFNCNCEGENFLICSANDIFSKDEIDFGTRTLISAIVKNEEIKSSDSVLDLACGYGIVGLVMARKYNCVVDMCDINNTAVELSKKNAKINNCNIRNIFVSDGCNSAGTYDYILCNPPIKVGKEITFDILKSTYSHLNPNGKLYIVVRKDHGMASIREMLNSLYGNCEIVKRNKGHYVIKCERK